MHFIIGIKKIFFISAYIYLHASINAVKDKIDMNKNLIMHD